MILVNPDKGSHIDERNGAVFVDWLISLPAQELISQFGVETFGQPLFVPNSTAWRAAH